MECIFVCLCAQWCGSCRTYQNIFKEITKNYPGHTFIWIDVEDEADLLEDLDIDSFPSILIADRQNNLYYFGSITPHIETLKRLCDAAITGSLSIVGTTSELNKIIPKLWIWSSSRSDSGNDGSFIKCPL